MDFDGMYCLLGFDGIKLKIMGNIYIYRYMCVYVCVVGYKARLCLLVSVTPMIYSYFSINPVVNL